MDNTTQQLPINLSSISSHLYSIEATLQGAKRTLEKFKNLHPSMFVAMDMSWANRLQTQVNDLVKSPEIIEAMNKIQQAQESMLQALPTSKLHENICDQLKNIWSPPLGGPYKLGQQELFQSIDSITNSQEWKELLRRAEQE